MNDSHAKFKTQSAMEYLMTYGWAILIIAVVMVALFALGVFNGSNFGPRATPGACQVVRNAESVTLQGQCQGELPMYAAYFSAQSGQSAVTISTPSVESAIGSGFSESAWIYDMASPTSRNDIVSAYGTYLNLQGSQLCFWVSGVNTKYLCSGSTGVSQNTWSFVAATYSNGAETVYIDGQAAANTLLSGTPTGGAVPATIGECGYCGSVHFSFLGYISNVQMYNTTLSANDINALYHEGIGGAPIDPLHIVGWWPLNGNAQDYSGNSNNGQETSISYTSSWTSGYTVP